MDIKKKIKGLPQSAGVYLIKDAKGMILYIGKAACLRKRINSYFQRPAEAKTRRLLSRAQDIDCIQTSSSAQALLLENCLIKKYQPRYNAALKDDKSYPYVKFSRGDFPRVSIIRGRLEKGARYFGPYTSVKLLKSALKTARVIFPFRSCRHLPKRPCLYFNLKLCPGMCTVPVDKEAYRQMLRHLGLFLQGRQKELLNILSARMKQAAQLKDYEQAARLRDKIKALTDIGAQTKEPKHPDLILKLQQLLGLPRAPYRIEAYDISEISGSGLAGSMVSFLGGWPDKKYYRKFRIKTVQGVDDYAMIREVLRRRFSGKNRQELPMPDLVMIDGGKGHLSSARKELRLLGMGEISVISLAKRMETIYAPGLNAVNLARNSALLHLLQRIRDEAHRFAVSYHHKLKERCLRLSALDEIPGVGPKKKRLLLRHFKSLADIKKAGLKELLKIKGIDRKTAKNVLAMRLF